MEGDEVLKGAIVGACDDKLVFPGGRVIVTSDGDIVVDSNRDGELERFDRTDVEARVGNSDLCKEGGNEGSELAISVGCSLGWLDMIEDGCNEKWGNEEGGEVDCWTSDTDGSCEGKLEERVTGRLLGFVEGLLVTLYDIRDGVEVGRVVGSLVEESVGLV
jgi:hypothetical protein